MGAVVVERLGEGVPEPEARPAPRSGFRPDIQALRAVAVLAVVLNHLWPSSLTGGYVGVDVFFVISGFLISSHLGREISRTGRVRLGRFYARRVRRLLPAAFLVLGASVVAAYFLLPYPRWSGTAIEAVASASYWENWLLAAQSVDYSAHNQAASLVQHYWSLSVEEQFYLVWPLLLVLLFAVRGRRAQLAGVVLVGAASFAYCVHLTATSPNQAYFVTPVRVWEFALGAAVALAGARLVPPRWVAAVASLAGFAMIVGSAVAYGHDTPFPGYAALVPTVGTALVIVAGSRTGWQWHTPVTSSAPVQFLGDISYSLYLWHWPLILLAPFVLGGVPTTVQWLGVLGVAVVLAYLSKVLVEDRGMSWKVLTGSTALTFAGMVAGITVVAVAAWSLNWTYERHVAQAEREMAVAERAPKLCHGAAALDPANDCADPLGPARVVAMGPANQYYRTPPECRQLDEYMVGSRRTTSVCDFGREGTPERTVWLVGDSHAQQWQGALLDIGRERGWVVKLSYLGGCPFAKIDFVGYRARLPEASTRPCTDWTERMAEVIAQDSPAAVFTSFYAREEYADDGSGRSQTDQYREGLEPYWRMWTEAGARVVVLADPPLNRVVRPVDCVTLNPTDPLTCAVDRARAHPPDPLTEAARGSDEVTLLDLTDHFCDERRCYAVVGNVAVYFDGDHLNLEFVRTLRPMIAATLPTP